MKKSFCSIFVMAFAVTAIFASAISKDYYSADEVTGIKSQLKYENIQIQTGSVSEIEVTVDFNNYHKIPEIELSDGILSISSVKNGTLAEYCTVYINVPSDFNFDYLDLSSLSGDIDLKGIAAEKLYASASSGDISCVDCGFSQIDAEVSSGDILLKRVTADEIVQSGKSGDINNEDVTAQSIKTELSSGDINLHRVTTDEIKCRATSGDIDTSKLSVKKFDCSTSSGSIEWELQDMPEENSSLTATSGRIELDVPRYAAFQVEATSKSGWLDDDLSDYSFVPRGTYKSKYNGGGVLITIQTSSGTINLDD